MLNCVRGGEREKKKRVRQSISSTVFMVYVLQGARRDKGMAGELRWTRFLMRLRAEHAGLHSKPASGDMEGGQSMVRYVYMVCIHGMYI